MRLFVEVLEYSVTEGREFDVEYGAINMNIKTFVYKFISRNLPNVTLVGSSTTIGS